MLNDVHHSFTAPPLEGLLTFVFTDIEGSTRLTSRLENVVGLQAYNDLRNLQRDVLLRLASENGGYEVGRAGDGHFFVFGDTTNALKAAVEFQNAMPIKTRVGSETAMIAVRIGIHRCKAKRSAEQTDFQGLTLFEYPGDDTNFAARIGALGMGGQIILSQSAANEIWGNSVLNQFKYRDPEDFTVNFGDMPMALRCWPSRKLKSYEEYPNHVFEVLYSEQVGKNWNEPGSRFFPEFFVRDVNRYIERSDMQNRLYSALQLSDKSSGHLSPHGGIVIVRAEGGMGKTRLAVTCAIRSAEEYYDGVYFVTLSMPIESAEKGMGNEAFLVGSLLAALPVRRREEWGLTYPTGLVPPLQDVTKVLASLDILLVLDNYETLNDEVGHHFLQQFAQCVARVIVTTRVHPNVQGIGTIVSLEDGMSSDEARDLLIDRVRQNRAGWLPSPMDEEAIMELIGLTGGSPLALELASARAPEIEFGKIAHELRNQPLRSALASFANWDDEIAFQRHRSIVRTFDWSFRLLGPNARRAFAAAGLFASSFTSDELQIVANTDPDLVVTLSRCSLIRPGEKNRFYLHHIARAYARLHLLGGEVVVSLSSDRPVSEKRKARRDSMKIKRRFADLYAKYIQSCRTNDALLVDNEAIRADLALECGNILEACSVFCTLDYSDNFYEFADFGSYLHRIGDWTRELDLYNRLAASIADQPERLTERASISFATGNALNRLRNYNGAIGAYREVMSIAQTICDLEGTAASLYGIGSALDGLSQWDEALNNYEEAYSVFTQIGNRQGQASSLFGKANVFDEMDRWEDAVAEYDRSLEIAQNDCNMQLVAAALHGKANSVYRLGRLEDALNIYDSCLKIKREIGYRRSEAESQMGKANVLDKLNRWDEAISIYEQCYLAYQESEDSMGKAMSLTNMVNPLVQIGRGKEAGKKVQIAIAIFRKCDDIRWLGIALRRFSEALNASGDRKGAINAAQESVYQLSKTQDIVSKKRAEDLLAKLMKE